MEKIRKSGSVVTGKGGAATGIGVLKKRKRVSEDDEDVIKAGDVLTDSDEEEEEEEEEVAVTRGYRPANTKTLTSVSTPSHVKSKRVRHIQPKPNNVDSNKKVDTPTTARVDASVPASQGKTAKSKHIKLTYNSAATRQTLTDLGLGDTDATRMVMVKKSTLDHLKRENEMLKKNNVKLNERNNEISTVAGIVGRTENLRMDCNTPHPQRIQQNCGTPLFPQQLLPSPSFISTPSSPSSTLPGFAPFNSLPPHTPSPSCNQAIPSSIPQLVGAAGTLPPYAVQLLTRNQALERKLQMAFAQMQTVQQRALKLEDDLEAFGQACLEFARLENKEKEGKKKTKKNETKANKQSADSKRKGAVR